MKKFYLLALAAATAASALATDLEFSYNYSNVAPGYYGTKKKENYDVAICIENPALIGTKITGVKVQLPGDASLYAAPSAFLTSELVVERVDGVRVNVPDIASVAGSIADGYLTATFDEPYTLTADPVYVGYSFEVSELQEASKLPVAIVPGTDPKGFFFHSSRTQLKWADYSEKDNGMQSAMIVLLDGSFPTSSAGVSLPQRTVFLADKPGEYSFDVVNAGSDPISSVAYSWSVADLSGEGEYTFETPIPASLGSKGAVTFELPAISGIGYYDISVKIDKVNGTANINGGAEASSALAISSIIPVNRPLVEEYTGLWCGWCPRGYAALEYMKEEEPEDFVAVAWHNSDAMAVTYSFPNSPRGLPAAYINRDLSIDPGEIPASWETSRQNMADIALDCTARYTDDTKSTLEATVNVISLSNVEDAGYTVGYILVADGLKDPTYMQTNYYAGNAAQSATLPAPWDDVFLNGGSPIFGLVYNDVAINNEFAGGMRNSLPSDIKAFETMTTSAEFNTADFRSVYLRPTDDEPDLNVIPVDKDKVRVIAYVIDGQGKVINSVSSEYLGGPGVGVSTVAADNAAVVETRYYDLQGRLVATPAAGLFIKTERLADGSLRTTKTILR